MKAHELMIGDLVIFNDEIHKITDLSLCLDGSVLVYVDGHDVQIFEHEISPIPLTEETLKANGWRYDYIYKIWVYEDEDKMDFCVKIDEIRGMSVSLYKDYPVIFITYVHELQHALRLCGLNELADNFKVN